MFGWLSAGLAFIFLIVAILGLTNKQVKGFLNAFSFGLGSNMVVLILLVLAVIGGGFGYASSWLGTASAVGIGSNNVDGMMATQLERCDYSSATLVAGTNITARQDPNSNNRVFLDIDESDYQDAVEGYEVNVTFNCYRMGATDKAGAVELVAKGPSFASETSTTDSSTYNILETSSRPSPIFQGSYLQTIYLDDDASVSTSDSQEFTYIEFAEGEKSSVVSILGEIDSTSFANLNNQTTKEIVLSQRVDGSDSPMGYVAITKVA